MAKDNLDFIKENSSLIYEYINKEVLKDIGVMNSNYFIKIIHDILANNQKEDSNINLINQNILPYFIFTQISKTLKLDYTTFRTETINFKELNKEAATYYNYIEFLIKDDYFYINLMQSKIGGMPIDKDIIKYSKKVAISKTGLKEFVLSNK